MKWLKWIGISLAGLIVLTVAVLLVLNTFSDAGSIHTSTEIAAPRNQVWAFIDDGDKLKQWVGWLVEVKQGQPRGEGSQQTWVMKDENNGGAFMTIHGRCTEYVPDSRMAITLTVPDVFDGTQSYLLTDLGNGRTRLDVDGRYHFTQWFANLMTPLVMASAKSKMLTDLARLKSLAELHR